MVEDRRAGRARFGGVVGLAHPEVAVGGHGGVGVGDAVVEAELPGDLGGARIDAEEEPRVARARADQLVRVGTGEDRVFDALDAGTGRGVDEQDLLIDEVVVVVGRLFVGCTKDQEAAARGVKASAVFVERHRPEDPRLFARTGAIGAQHVAQVEPALIEWEPVGHG